MSLYINGVRQSTLFVLPLLGKHPYEYPRFRDCLLHPKYDSMIYVFTRVGGGNRYDYKDEIDELRASDGYVTDYDDDFDSTYATFVFKIPEKWKLDVAKYLQGEIHRTSKEYQDLICATFPKVRERLTEMFQAQREDSDD